MVSAHAKRAKAERQAAAKQVNSTIEAAPSETVEMPQSSFEGSMDGPADERNRSPARSVTSHHSAGSRGTAPVTMGASVLTRPNITNTRIELGAEFYKGPGDSQFANRPKYENRLGKPVPVAVNQFKIMNWSDKPIYQYDVLIGTGNEKAGKIRKVWGSKPVQDLLASVKAKFLFDGKRLAWSSTDAGNGREAQVVVDLDKENGREPRQGKGPDMCRVVIKRTAIINMAVINAYLNGQLDNIPQVGDALNFLDHAIRQWPTENHIVAKRSFFGKNEKRVLLDDYIEAVKGAYASVRLTPLKGSLSNSKGLGVNVDVANGTFWTAGPLINIARNVAKEGNRNKDWETFHRLLRPVRNQQHNEWNKSRNFQELNKLQKLKFTVRHRGRPNADQVYTIARVMFSPKYEGNGATARSVTFEYQDPTGQAPARTISVMDYFKVKYNVKLQYPDLPLIEATKGGFFPMELCEVVENQRYLYKLNPDQTANMIKFAVTRPKQRQEAIQNGLRLLNWPADPYLKHFGIQIETQMTKAQARLLPPPTVVFSGTASKCTPGTSGRWDLRGKKFLVNNRGNSLKSWGICIVNGCIDKAAGAKFVSQFVSIYQGHGGLVDNREGHVVEFTHSNPGNVAAAAWKAIGDKFNMRPQLIFFVLPGRDSWVYDSLKKNMDCRFGQVSQMVQVAKVRNLSPQYLSNVSMKVNAKLGGCTAQAGDLIDRLQSYFNGPTMIIGADVSHAAPGSAQGSMAAMTVSMDKLGARYAAAVETNGYRVEMITERNIRTHLLPLIEHWGVTVANKSLPQHIYYLRDGVSEGQFQHVLDQEVFYIKKAIKERWPSNDLPKFTVIICGKRHHIRLFPAGNGAGDKNGNAEPGTVLDTDVTHPFHWDFYLNSHSAIQGTARPMHYQVILDEAAVPPRRLEAMLYHHCYQYIRSTTPVSMHPAIYYAHLASLRARSHDDQAASEGPQGGSRGIERRLEEVARARAAGQAYDPTMPDIDVRPLTPLACLAKDGDISKKMMQTSMWFI